MCVCVGGGGGGGWLGRGDQLTSKMYLIFGIKIQDCLFWGVNPPPDETLILCVIQGSI